MKNILFYVFALFLVACDKASNSPNNSNAVRQTISISASNVFTNPDSLNLLIGKALQGDTIAYGEISNASADMGSHERILRIALIVSNKYKNPQSMLDVYWGLTSPNSLNELNTLDSSTKALAYYYLLRSYELQYPIAELEVSKIFDIDSIPKSQHYLTLFYSGIYPTPSHTKRGY